MISLRDAIITGGDFRQQITHVHHVDSPLDRLQSRVAHTAFHNSAQRVDAPRCHPNTRVTVKQEAHQWAMRSDDTSAAVSVMWLSGGAGAGKSAIAQSLAEEWFNLGILLAGFFFNRSDPTRNHIGALVATLAVQIYNATPQEIRDLILQVVEEDALVWSKDIFAQFNSLIAKPLHGLVQSGFFQNISSPRIFVIDGLDECLDWTMQGKVVQLVQKAVHEWQLPFLFLIASRPEPDILVGFDFLERTVPCLRTDLSKDHYAENEMDIMYFLRDKFEECRTSHPFRQYIPPDWPSDDAIYELVDKSSGHFLYASVAVQYVTSNRHHPHRRLETILKLRPAKSSAEAPFAQIDTLYSQILSSVQDFPLVRRILALYTTHKFVLPITNIEAFLQLEDGDVHAAFADMMSLVSPRGRPPHQTIRIHHASFREYLFDRSRSQEYHIDVSQSFQENIMKCLSWLTLWLDNANKVIIWLSLSYLRQHFNQVANDNGFVQFMLSNLSFYRLYLNRSQSNNPDYFSILSFISYILSLLDASTLPLSEQLTQKIRADFGQIIRERLEQLPKNNRLQLNIAAVTGHAILYYNKKYNCCLDDNFQYMTTYRADDPRSSFVFPRTPSETSHRDYLMELRRFFTDPTCSGEYAVCLDTLSGAAMFCIEHLQRNDMKRNDMKYSTTKLLPKWSPRASQLRKNSPWKWRRKLIFVTYHGKGLRSTIPQVLPAYFRRPGPRTDKEVITEWRNDEYFMALAQVARLLPHAAYSSELVEACRSAAFSGLSINFPRLTKRARRAMKEYLIHWECPLC